VWLHDLLGNACPGLLAVSAGGTRVTSAAGTPLSRSGPDAVAPDYLLPAEVGQLLRLSVKSVYRLAAQDASMPMLKLGGSVRFPRRRLEEWLRDHEQGRPRILRRRMPFVVKPAEDKGPDGA